MSGSSDTTGGPAGTHSPTLKKVFSTSAVLGRHRHQVVEPVPRLGEVGLALVDHRRGGGDLVAAARRGRRPARGRQARPRGRAARRPGQRPVRRPGARSTPLRRAGRSGARIRSRPGPGSRPPRCAAPRITSISSVRLPVSMFSWRAWNSARRRGARHLGLRQRRVDDVEPVALLDRAAALHRPLHQPATGGATSVDSPST